MLLYHGSFRDFEKFIISKELTITTETSLMEGEGVYLSNNYNIAKAHGNVIYVVDVPDDLVLNMSKREVVQKVIKELAQEVNIPFEHYINLDVDIIEGILEGEISVIKLAKEIGDWLDSNYYFYDDYKDFITYEDNCIFEKIKESLEEIYNRYLVIGYYDKSYNANNFICRKNEDQLIIKCKDII